MKVVRIILILIALLFLIFIGVGLFGPTGMDVKVEKELNAPISSVYGHCADFKNWEEWSPWAASDTTMKITYGETTSGVGGSYKWSGGATGKGEMKISEVKPNEFLGMDIGFSMDENKEELDWSTANMSFKENGDKTMVTWEFHSENQTGFMQRIFNVMGPSMLTSQYEKGLARLEEVAIETPISSEVSKPSNSESGVVEKEMNGFYYVGKRHENVDISPANYKAVSDIYNSSFGMINQFLGQSGNKEMIVPPALSLTYAYDKETFISSFAPAFMVSEKLDAKGAGLDSEWIKPHTALSYIHKGAYDDMTASYEMIRGELMSKGYEMQFPTYELYSVSLENEPDTSKWETEIVIPVSWK